ncbi:uncharacterized protein LOC119591005 [Penaeus monodon]|uniref:uncharacterized protein LOC119591005 n=1 Tax=Penaeus monodon TaxID=6687 RepID=UPI0018A7AE10|nr:uncharacterized protein LOC119591005 [Penaeus monodon]
MSYSTVMVPITNETEIIQNIVNTYAFEEGSSILMLWTFNENAIDSVSVTAFKHLNEELEMFLPLQGQELPWFHMWKYSLLDSDITLLSHLEEILTEARSLAYLRKEIYAYALGKASLSRYLDLLENVYATKNQSAVDEIGNAQSEGEEILEHFQCTISSIKALLKDWGAVNIYQVNRMNSHFSHLQDLWGTDERLLNSYSISLLKMTTLDKYESTSKALDLLLANAFEIHIASTYKMHIRFLRQLNLLIEYAITVLQTFETRDFETANFTSMESTSTPPSNASTINSTRAETEKCNSSQSLYCVAQRLVEALRDAQNVSLVATQTIMDSNTTFNATPATPYNISDVDSMEFDIKFEFESLRMNAYDLWKIIAEQKFSLEEFYEVLTLLKKSKQMGEDLVDSLEDAATNLEKTTSVNEATGSTPTVPS